MWPAEAQPKDLSTPERKFRSSYGAGHRRYHGLTGRLLSFAGEKRNRLSGKRVREKSGCAK